MATVPATDASVYTAMPRESAQMQVPFVGLKEQYATIRNDVQGVLSAALESMDLVCGPNIRAFEAEFVAYCRTRFAVGVSSGTDALYLALRACGVRRGDEVITVAHTSAGTLAIVLPAVRSAASHVYDRYVMQTPNRDRIREELADRGVTTGVHYAPALHLQPFVRELGRIGGDLPVTEALARRVRSLPMYPELDEAQVAYVAACLHACLAERREVHLAS
jgi:dTDP-4-amino-4,6-dideoxygalactose transaminase